MVARLAETGADATTESYQVVQSESDVESDPGVGDRLQQRRAQFAHEIETWSLSPLPYPYCGKRVPGGR